MSSLGMDVGDCQSPKGKISRFNAVKHGLTAKTAVLPGEDAEAYQAKVDSYKANLETRNELEDELAEQAALASWQINRANGSEVARLTRDILTKPAAEALREELEAVALGHRLMHDRRGPMELYPSRDYDKQQPRTSWDDDPNDPDHPAKLIPQLEATLAGCRVLLKYWGELRGVLELGVGWQSHEKLKCCRLLRRQPINAASAREVAEVFLACHAVNPRSACAFQELRCEIHEDRFKRHKADLDRWNHAGITPADAKAGQAVLLRIVDEATARLRILEARHQRLADTLDGLQTKILSFDNSKSGEQLRRHLVSCDRMKLRNIEAIKKDRRDEARGWGKTKKERERRKEDKRNVKQGDERLVLDEQGIVHDAVDYVEAGLDRYEAKLGFGTPRTRRVIEDEVIPPFVPDFARWTAEEERRVEGGGRRTDGDGAESGCENGSEDAEEVKGVPLMLTEERERANQQNEIRECEPEVQNLPIGSGIAARMELEETAERNKKRTDAGVSVRGEEGEEAGCHLADGEVERHDVNSLMLAEKGERANQQNETGEGSEEGLVVEEGAKETNGQADGGVEDPLRTKEGDGGVEDLCRTDDCVPLMLTEEGEQANQQNEIGKSSGVGRAIEDGIEKTEGHSDGGVGNPCRTERFDGLILEKGTLLASVGYLEEFLE